MANGLRDRRSLGSRFFEDERLQRQQQQDRRTLDERFFEDDQSIPAKAEGGIFPDDPPTLRRGINQALAEQSGSFLGARAIGAQLLGDETRSEELQESARIQLERGSQIGPRVQDISTAFESVENLSNFILGGFGRVLPSAATAVAGGGVGGAVGSFAGRALAKRAVSEGVKQSLRRRGRNVGAVAGLTAASQPQESGAIFAEIDPNADTDFSRGEQALLALGGGSAAAALDILPQTRILKRVLNPGKFRKVRQGIIREVGKQAAFEGVTEASQELIQKATNAYIDKNVDVFDENTLNELGTAGALGIIGGGSLGGLSGAAARFAESADVEIPGFTRTRLSGDDVIRGAGRAGQGLGRAAAAVREEIRKADAVVRTFVGGEQGFVRSTRRQDEEEYVPGEDREEDPIPRTAEEEERLRQDEDRLLREQFNESLDIDIDALLEDRDLVTQFFDDDNFRAAVEEFNPEIDPGAPNFNAILKDTVQRAAERAAELRAAEQAGVEQDSTAFAVQPGEDLDDVEAIQDAQIRREEGDEDSGQVQTFETGVRELEGEPSRRKIKAVKGARPEFPSPAQKPQEGRDSTSFRDNLQPGETLVSFDRLVDEVIDVAPNQRNSQEQALVGDEEARTPAARQAIKNRVADRLLADLERRGVKNLDQLKALRAEDTNSFLARFETAQSEGPPIFTGETNLNAAQIQDIKQRGRQAKPGTRFAPVFGVKVEGTRVRLDPRALVKAAINSNGELRSIENRTERAAKAFAEGMGALINQGEINTFEEPADNVVIDPRNKDRPRTSTNRDITYGEIKALSELDVLLGFLRKIREKPPQAPEKKVKEAKEKAENRAKALRKSLGKDHEFISLIEDDLFGGNKRQVVDRLKELKQMEKKDPAQFVRINGESERLELEAIIRSTEASRAEIEIERLEPLAKNDPQRFEELGGEERLAKLKKIVNPIKDPVDRVIYDSAIDEIEDVQGDALGVYKHNRRGDMFDGLVRRIKEVNAKKMGIINKAKSEKRQRTKQEDIAISALEARIEAMRNGLDELASRSLILSVQQRSFERPAPFASQEQLPLFKVQPPVDIEERLSEQLALQRNKVRQAKKKFNEIKEKGGKGVGDRMRKQSQVLRDEQEALIALQREASDLVEDGDLHFRLGIGDLEQVRDFNKFRPLKHPVSENLKELRKEIIDLKNKLAGKNKKATPELNPLRDQLDQYLKEEKRLRATGTETLNKNTAQLFFRRVEFLNELVKDIQKTLGEIQRGEVQASSAPIFDLLLITKQEIEAFNALLDKNGRHFRELATGLGRTTESPGSLNFALGEDNLRSQTREAWNEAKKKVNEYLERTIGQRAVFREKDESVIPGTDIKGAGATMRDTGIIYVSYYAADPLSTAFHESLHYAYNNILTQSQKADLTAFFGKKKNLNRLIKAIKNTNYFPENRKPGVIEVVSEDSRRGVEERSAYGYQLWMAGEFDPAPATSKVFEFVKKILRDVLGILATSERADLIFKALRDGALLRAANDKRPWVYPGTEDSGIKRGMRMVETITDKHLRPFMQGYTMPVSIWARTHPNPVVRKIIGSLVHSPLSPENQATYMEVKNLRARKFAQKWYVGTGWADLSKQQRNSVRDNIYARTPVDQIEDPDVREYIENFRPFMNEMHQYMADAGLEIGYVDSFFPRVWDVVRVHENKEEFLAMMNRHKAELEAVNLTPEEALDAITRADGNELSIPDILTAFAEKKFTKKGLPPELAKELQGKSVIQINDDIKRFAELEDKFIKEGNEQERIRVAQKKQAYELWANNVLGTFVHAPGSMSTKSRTFKFLDNEDLTPFLEQNFEAVMSKYVTSVVKRAEFARRFGEDGQKLREQVAEARAIGLSPKDEELLDNAMAAVRGTLGTNMNPRLRKISSWLIFYQNFRLLSLSAFTATADISGILMRSQDAGIFWNSMKVATKQIAQDLFPREEIKKIKRRIRELDNKESLTKEEKKELVGLKKQRRELKGDMFRIATEMGAIESNVMHESLNNRFGHEFLYSKSETANNVFFTWTGLEYVTQITRLAGTAAGMSFIKSHASRALDGNARSKEFLAELNLTTSDIVLDEDGEIIISTAAIEQAIVSGAMPKAQLEALGISEQDVQKAKDFIEFVHSGKMMSKAKKQTPADIQAELAAINKVRRAAGNIQSKMELAVNRFVDQAIPRPNAGDRPAQLSNPHLMLILHLKQFIFTFQTQMLNRVGKQAVQGNFKPALYLMSFIPVIMAIDALRHTVQYWWDDPDWDDDWSAADHVFYAAQRGGLLGMTEFAVDVNRNLNKRTGTGVEALGGPTVEQSMDIIRSMLTGNPGNMQTFTEALPAQNLYKNWPIFQDGEE